MATPTPSFTTTTSISSGPPSQLTPATTASTTNTTTSTPAAAAAGITPPSTTSTNHPNTASPPTFEFPREYHFPPFFTRQPNLSTRHSQDMKWASLILSYCAFHRLFKLSLTSPATEDLFYNRRIGRRLSLADAREVLEFMRRDGRVEYVKGSEGKGGGRGEEGGGGGDIVWVWWKTPEEWAGLVESWVDETAQKGTVLTLYELTEGEDAKGTEFHGLDPELLQKALQVLVRRGKAQIFGQEDQLGVKFF
ncbi:ESCRT-II complex subunit-domain-containing protein [Xylariaceae sp. FL1651]|nr:ESCRT-II complex subunit-domain-containing protein [Xylariaceae sp. FL1651]